MKAVIQCVDGAKLSVDGSVVSEIGRGLVVYLGIEQSDDSSAAEAFAKKLAAMRIFQDGAGKLNLSVVDIGGDILLVSNFTLCADISHGNRPSFADAMPPREASHIFDYCALTLRKLLLDIGGAEKVKCGVFGADMSIEQTNAGPITIIY